MMDSSQRLLFRCDGGSISEVGTGHLRRCLLLIGYHGRRYGSVCKILMRDDAAGQALIQASQVPVAVEVISQEANELSALERQLKAFQPHLCVFDQLVVSEEALALCRRHAVVSVAMDAEGTAVEQADIAVNAIREDVRTPYTGPDYITLPELPTPAQPDGTHRGVHVFISTGGYDHHRLAPRVVNAVRRLPEIDRIRVVAANAELSRQCSMGDQDRRVEVTHGVPELSPLLSASDLAVVCGGLTLFEAMRLGIPSIVVAQYPHQAATAQRYAARGAVVALGLASSALEAQVEHAVAGLIRTPDRRQALGRVAQHLIDGRGLQRVGDLTRVCELLTWDTEFFGRRIADLKPLRLTERILDYAFRRCQEWGVECLYYQSDCHHARSVSLAERHGFHFVDIRLTFEYQFSAARRRMARAMPAGLQIRPADIADLPALQDIASDSYLDSRYYFDERFPRERCQTFYTEWIAKCVRGMADRVLVAEQAGHVVGYVACRRLLPMLGNLDLIGVHPAARRQGTGRALVQAALDYFATQAVERVQVVTQGRNYPSQRLYQRCGFVTKHSRLWYHKWFA